MAIKTKYYIGNPSATGFYDAELSNTVIYRVTRSGLAYSKVSSTPSSLQFNYDPATGHISFDPTNPFATLSEVFPHTITNLERLSVKFRTP